MPLYLALREHRVDLQHALIEQLDHFGFYTGDTFNRTRFKAFVVGLNAPWPTTPAGTFSLDKETLTERSLAHPELRDFYDLRCALSCLKNVELAIGSDGRARTSLRPFGSVTSRCQPSTAKFVFGWPRVFRRLVRPTLGRALAYVDVGQEEFAIAAVLGNDPAMRDAYASGDCYLAFAKQAGAAPPDATKKSHADVRERYKSVVLSVQYLMTALGLGHKLNVHQAEAQVLIDRHRRVYSIYWSWSDAVLRYARMYGKLTSAHGWLLNVTPATKDRTIRNWPMQTLGAELLRIALPYALADGVEVIAPVHDAMLVEADADRIEEAAAKTVDAWKRAGRELLSGFDLRVDTKLIVAPERYVDDKGDSLLLKTVQRVLLEKTGVLHGA